MTAFEYQPRPERGPGGAEVDEAEMDVSQPSGGGSGWTLIEQFRSRFGLSTGRCVSKAREMGSTGYADMGWE